MKDTTSTIIKSAKGFFSGTILSRVTGMLRDIAMAFAFGTEGSVAAFMVAFRFSHLLRRLLGEGGLQTAFIPHFEELRTEDPKRAYRFFQDLYGSLTLLLLGIILLTCFGLGLVLYYELLSPGNHQILELTLLMMPSLLFICLYGLNASLLQCEKKFFLSSVAPVAFNLVWIGGVLSIWFLKPANPMPWLSFAVIIACLCQWAITLPQVWRSVKAAIGKLGTFRLYSPELRRLLVPLFCGVAGVAASQCNNALDAVFARYADAEGPAFLWYAMRLQQLPLALFGIAISSALLPPLSRAIKSGDVAAYSRFLDYTLSRSLALMIPITFGLLVLGDSCINLIYGHGHFGDRSVVETTQCLWAYTLGLTPMALVLVYAPAFYAKGNYRLPTIASTASVILNIPLNTVLIALLGLGATSVALATSASAWLNLAILSRYLRREMGAAPSTGLLWDGSKLFVASLLAAAGVLAVRALFWEDTLAWQVVHNGLPTFPRHLIHQMLALTVQGSCFLALFLSCCLILRVEAVNELFAALKGKRIEA
jgi:putative peptidoglycan lipid II flippase